MSETATIETDVPARLDRLPWSRFHWMIVIGLGTVWILDGLEVTIVGSIASRLTEKGSGLTLDPSQIGTAAAFYVGGACLGALFFGQLTDRLGRKKLFLVTLALYIVATVATAFSFTAWYFYAARFFTGAGIGGEYAAINSAIDELIPARVRGRVDLIINGSYWLGAAGGALLAVPLLDTALFAADFGWRLAFGIGAALGIGILLVRRHVPESPRWLFIHGRGDEADEIVGEIEEEVREETGQELEEPEESITIRPRERIRFGEIARTAFSTYPRRTALGLALFVGQAFLYNAVTFDLGTLLGEFFEVGSGTIPLYIAVFAISNFCGPLILGRFFDTVGRKPMVSATYLLSAAVTALLGVFLLGGSLTTLIVHGLHHRHLLHRLRRRQLRLPDGQRDLPDGDEGALDRVLLRGRDRRGRDRRAAPVRPPDRLRQRKPGRDRLLHRRRRDGGRRHRRDPVRRQRRAGDARGRRRTADRGGGRGGEREAEEPRREPEPGLRRWPPRVATSPGMPVSAPFAAVGFMREVEMIDRALRDSGAANRRELGRRVGARYWGPGRFRAALHEAIAEGRVKRLRGGEYAPSG